jgi:hypothetical protein
MKYLKHTIALQLVILLAGCNAKPDTQQVTSTPVQQMAVNKKPGTGFTDSVYFDKLVAVFYKPDTVQLEKIKNVTNPMVFNSMVHENFYLMRNARIVLQKYYPHVKIVEATKCRFLLFAVEGKKTTRVDLNERNDAFGLFLSDGKNEPKQVDMNNIDTELGFYFKSGKK